MIFIPIPLLGKVIQTSSCTMLLYKCVIQIVFGMGVGMNVTAQETSSHSSSCLASDPCPTSQMSICSSRPTGATRIRMALRKSADAPTLR